MLGYDGMLTTLSWLCASKSTTPEEGLLLYSSPLDQLSRTLATIVQP